MILSQQAEMAAVLQTAQMMCAAARTAPKAKGQDLIDTCILTGEELLQLADQMERLAEEYGFGFFLRDAQNIRESAAVVLIGTRCATHGLNAGCQLCGAQDCADCVQKGAVCIYSPLDLGIALGSAVAIADAHHVDNRIMFSAGKAALNMGWMEKDISIIMAIPLSVTGKSPFFDRKSQK